MCNFFCFFLLASGERDFNNLIFENYKNNNIIAGNLGVDEDGCLYRTLSFFIFQNSN